ncbi:collagen alpha-1(XII) chain-like [Pelmatolapia mariae]|uniref:collagen alpha-1(XII) chain-like n=1 Tax=Pelmatolapia mariae TaxID=158779 RepID=UPI002FE563F2
MTCRLSLAAVIALLALLLPSSQAQEQDTQSNTTAKADIVLLLDGSWSIGQINFQTIRNFIARMVSVFNIGPDSVQIGLTQYSNKPKTEWNLNAHPTKASLLRAVATLPYRGGITLTDTQCNTTVKADIMLLVDGSWSIGRKNFKTMRNFIARLVSVFDIGPDRVQIGLAQYSGDPKTEWHLNTHPTKESLLNAVANLPYKGGNTMTGMALNHILQNNFKPNVGLRPDSHKIGILITDGKSQDEVILNSQNLRDSGIELYAIGVKNADENELRSIASDPDDIYMYNVYDFKFLVDIVDELSVNLCNSVKGSGHTLEAPTNLVTSEVTQSSFRATWTPPNGTVEKYHVTYMIARKRIEKLLVKGSVSTVVLENLNPLTEYIINVYAVVGKRSSEPLRGTETTRDG